MPPIKKSVPSKFLTAELDDFLTDLEFHNGSPKKNKPTERQKVVTVKAEVPNLSDTSQTVAMKKKKYESIEACGELRQKTLTVIMNRQLDAWKQVNEKMLKNLSDVKEDFEADYNAFKENKQKLEQLMESSMKCMQQSITAEQNLDNSIKELYASFKKRYDDFYLEQRSEMEKLGEALGEDISELKQKLIKEPSVENGRIYKNT